MRTLGGQTIDSFAISTRSTKDKRSNNRLAVIIQKMLVSTFCDGFGESSDLIIMNATESRRRLTTLFLTLLPTNGLMGDTADRFGLVLTKIERHIVSTAPNQSMWLGHRIRGSKKGKKFVDVKFLVTNVRCMIQSSQWYHCFTYHHLARFCLWSNRQPRKYHETIFRHRILESNF